jgi:hypothetical protein
LGRPGAAFRRFMASDQRLGERRAALKVALTRVLQASGAGPGRAGFCGRHTVALSRVLQGSGRARP